MTVQIRQDISKEKIYAQAKQEKCSKVRARLLAVAAVIEGKKRGYAAQLAGVTINNLRSWIYRFNAKGFDGLIDKKPPGNESTWTSEIEAFLKEKGQKGACFELDKRVVFRLEDFQKMIEEKFGKHYGISTIWYKLKELGLSWITARQKHPKTDLVAQEEFKKKSQK